MRQGYRLGDQVLRHALVGVIDTIADTVAGDEQAVAGADSAEGAGDTPQPETDDNADTSGD
jgi:molecular chaperone GrpE